jgi:hypothetical protein
MWKRAAVACALLTAVACSKPVDLKQALQVTDYSSGWFDAGIVDGKNKLVPTVAFKLRQAEGTGLSNAALTIVFKFADSGEEHDNVFVQRVDFDGSVSKPVSVRSQTGYTGDPPQSRADMLKNSHFRDMDVEIFARQSSNWVSLHKARIDRVLLTK